MWFFINYHKYGNPLGFTEIYAFADNINSGQNEYIKFLVNNPLWVIKFGGLLSIMGIIGFWKEGKGFLQKSAELSVFVVWVILLVFILPAFVPGYIESSRFIIPSLTILAIFIPSGINYLFKKSSLKAAAYFLSVCYLILHSVIYIYRSTNSILLKNSSEVTQFVDDFVSSEHKAIMVAEGIKEHPWGDPTFYSRSIGHSRCGRGCTYIAQDIPVDNELELVDFIKSNNIIYFIVNGDYQPFDKQDILCKSYLLTNEFSLINDLGHTQIFMKN